MILRISYRDLSDDELTNLLFEMQGKSQGKIFLIEKVSHKSSNAKESGK
jgi:hypothetical protein